MKDSELRLCMPLVRIVVSLVLLGSMASPAWSENVSAPPQPPTQAPIFRNYSSLAELIGAVSEDGMIQFRGFFYPAAVHVEPFTVVGEFKEKRMTLLGQAMANQMEAMINNDYVTQPGAEDSKVQTLTGILQEIDGMLRISMTGNNARGDSHSHVVNVEMSEPVYRALHTSINN